MNKKNDDYIRIFCIFVLIVVATVLRLGVQASVAGEPRQSNNDECVVWQDYNETSSKAAFIPLNNDLVRTEDHVACRVLLYQSGLEGPSYYEFGVMHLSTRTSIKEGEDGLSSRCILHNDPCSSRNCSQQDIQIAVKNEAACTHFWAPLAFDVDPLGPNIVVVGKASALEDSTNLVDIAICRYREENGPERIGRMVMEGRLFGHCGYLVSDDADKIKEVFVGGNFHVLSAVPTETDHAEYNDDEENDEALFQSRFMEIQERVNLYLSREDRDLLSSISGHSVEELVEDLNNTNLVDIYVLNRILSMDRFIPHDVLNVKGLSLLRAVLAERMTLARRRHLGLDRHPDTVAWERNGVLLKDFDYYTDLEHGQEFSDLLRMVAASTSAPAAQHDFQWVERNVTTVAGDPQVEPHIDTFHSVIKMWVYERGVVTNATGPLHYMRGSNRNTRSKLQWIYNVSLPPASDAIKEPSLRFRGANDGSIEMTDIIRPVLPLDCYQRTLVIADTSGIHHRGKAVPGTVRKTIRVSNGNDGGLPRLNPFDWDGLNKPKETNGADACVDTSLE